MKSEVVGHDVEGVDDVQVTRVVAADHVGRLRQLSAPIHLQLWHQQVIQLQEASPISASVGRPWDSAKGVAAVMLERQGYSRVSMERKKHDAEPQLEQDAQGHEEPHGSPVPPLRMGGHGRRLLSGVQGLHGLRSKGAKLPSIFARG
jgi:hypothetical protein